MHSSCLSRHGAYITHIAAELPMVQSDLDGKCYHNIGLYSLEPLASSRHEEQSPLTPQPHILFFHFTLQTKPMLAEMTSLEAIY